MIVYLELIEISEEMICLRYQARNTTGEELYLFNRLFSTERSGLRHIDPNLVYLDFGGIEGATAHLAKQLIDLPESVLAKPEAPYLTRLAASGTFSEELTLPLPLRRYLPYDPPAAPRQEEVPAVCTQVVMTLGYFISHDPRSVREITVDGEPALSADYGLVIRHHDTAVSKPVAVECPSLRRMVGSSSL